MTGRSVDNMFDNYEEQDEEEADDLGQEEEMCQRVALVPADRDPVGKQQRRRGGKNGIEGVVARCGRDVVRVRSVQRRRKREKERPEAKPEENAGTIADPYADTGPTCKRNSDWRHHP